MYDVVTIGGSTLDIFMKDSEFEVSKESADVEKICMVLGEKLLVDDVYFTHGGGGMNTAVSFAGIGLETAFIGVVGNDEIGTGILKKIDEHGIEDALIVHNENEKSGLSVALHAGERERTILGYRGSNNMLVSKNIPGNLHELTNWVYLTHLSGKSDTCLGSIASAVAHEGTYLMWNPGSTQLKKGYSGMKELLKHTTILNLNKQEAELLAGVNVPRNTQLDIDQIDDVIVLFEEISKMGPQIIIITDGRRGAAVWENGKMVTSKNHDIAETVDTTGAGDAFGSGFLSGYIETGDVQKALAWGIIQGGAVITEFGAQNGLLSRNQMQEELQKM